MAVGSEAFKEELDNEARIYKKSNRNLFALNSIFLLLIVISILIPMSITAHMVMGVVLAVLYGFFRLYTLN